MFKRRSGLEKELHSDPYSGREQPNVSPLKERGASLLQRTLSSAAIYHTEKSPLLEEPDMIIGEGVSVSGEIVFEKTLRIDGEFKGELLSEGRLFIGPHGRVNCHINLSSAVVEGHVMGNITVTGSLEILGNAKVYGDISAGSLTVGPGVTLIGQVCVKQETRPVLHQEESFVLTPPPPTLPKESDLGI